MRHNMSVLRVLALLVASGWASGASAQALRGVLLDARTSAPLEAAQIHLVDSLATTVATEVTSAEGTFELPATVGATYQLRFDAVGYEGFVTDPFRFSASDTTQLSIVLAPRPMTLAELVVQGQGAERWGFEQRRSLRLGHFVGSEYFDGTQSASLVTKALQAPAVESDRMGQPGVLVRGRSGMCLPTLYVNGTRIPVDQTSLPSPVAVRPPPRPQGNRTNPDLRPTDPEYFAPVESSPEPIMRVSEPVTNGINLDRYVDRRDVRAMEIYTNPLEIPPPFSGSCGVIAIWTRTAFGD